MLASRGLLPPGVPPEVFKTSDVKKMLCNKFLVIIGPSVQRSIYKDLVLLLHNNRRLSNEELRRRGESTFCGDQLVEHTEMTKGKWYREVRQYLSDDGYHLVRFYFITRCYSTYMESILVDLSKEPIPDIVLINSCLWDVTRYGATSVETFRTNIQKVVQRFKQLLPEKCLFIWNATMPVSTNVRTKGTFLLQEFAFLQNILSIDVLQANYYTSQVVRDYGFDFVDLHYYFRNQLQHRNKDGVHWNAIVHRRVSNLLLTHICQAWGLGLPTKHPLMLRQRGAIPLVPIILPPEPFPERPPGARKHRRADTCDPGFLRGSSIPSTRNYSDQMPPDRSQVGYRSPEIYMNPEASNECADDHLLKEKIIQLFEAGFHQGTRLPLNLHENVNNIQKRHDGYRSPDIGIQSREDDSAWYLDNFSDELRSFDKPLSNVEKECPPTRAPTRVQQLLLQEIPEPITFQPAIRGLHPRSREKPYSNLPRRLREPLLNHPGMNEHDMFPVHPHPTIPKPHPWSREMPFNKFPRGEPLLNHPNMEERPDYHITNFPELPYKEVENYNSLEREIPWGSPQYGDFRDFSQTHSFQPDSFTTFNSEWVPFGNDQFVGPMRSTYNSKRYYPC